jgi:hypothetical protein
VYPGGAYATDVRGGRVVSRAGDPVLRVAACDGVSRVEVVVTPAGQSRASCSEPPATAAARAMRVTASPRVVVARRRATVRVLVRSGSHRVAAAVVRLAGARARTNAQGRATIRKRFMRVGLRKVVARATGYAPGRASVRVSRRRHRKGRVLAGISSP